MFALLFAVTINQYSAYLFLYITNQLLGGNNDDIDIAIDNMSGKEFAEKVNELLQEKQLETHSIGVIKVDASLVSPIFPPILS